MIFAIDFDGTCTTHDYPRVGKDIGAASVLKKLTDNGHQLMLWTMRGNKPSDDGDTLADAVNWFKENDIPLWGINENPDQKATGWTNSNKQYAQMYIDDAALGAPLKYDPNFHHKAFIDWVLVEEMLVAKGIL
jgi:hypothetical protein